MKSICNKPIFTTKKVSDTTASITRKNSRITATHPALKIQEVNADWCLHSPKTDEGAGIGDSQTEFLPATELPIARSVKNVLFLDARVEKYDSLASGATAGTEVFILDSQRDGVEQITRILANCSDLESLQIISHGREAAVQLGSIALSSDNIETYSHLLQQWGKALSERGAILLCGCSVAAGESGAAFVRRLKAITGADIAASDNLTGSAALGGDWKLEFVTGEIEASIAIEKAALEAYSYTLGTLVNETFKNATVRGPWIYGGNNGALFDPSSTLTASQQLIPGITGGSVSGILPAFGGRAPGDGALQLTPAANGRESFVIYNNPIPSTDGIRVKFDIYSYGSNATTTAPFPYDRSPSLIAPQPGDGLGFFLIDGTASPTRTGGFGGSLGYAPRTGINGILGGYLGIGLDEYGNFSTSTEGRSGPAPNPIPGSSLGDFRPDSVTLRGREANSYPFLTNAIVPFGIDNIPTSITYTGTFSDFNFSNTFTTSRDPARRAVQVTLNPSNDPVEPNRLTVSFDTDFDGTYETTLIDIANLATINGGTVPPNFKFGFGSSTGTGNNIHELQNVVVETVNPPSISADVTTIKTGPAFIKPGGSITYTITTVNKGPAPATNVLIQDEIPLELLIPPGNPPILNVSNNGIYQNQTKSVTWPLIPVLNPGETLTYSVTVNVRSDLPVGSTFSNIAFSNSSTFDPDLSNNTGIFPPGEIDGTGIVFTTIVDTVADVVTTKSGDLTAAAGSTITYTLNTTNRGPDPAIDVTITDSIVPGLTGVSFSNGGTYDAQTGIVSFPPVATLANGATEPRTVSFVAPATLNTISNTARSRSTTPDPIASNNNGSTTNKEETPTNSSVTTTITPNADLATTKTGSTTAIPGSSVTYAIATLNNGPSPAETVTITDSIVPGLTGVTASNDGVYDAVTGIVTFPPVAIANGETVRRTIGFTVPLTATSISNTARSSSITPDLTQGNNNGTDPSATVFTSVSSRADIVTQKTAPATIEAGDTLIYTITTSNNGPSTATNVVITDSLIPGLTNVTVSDGGTYNETTGTIDFPAIATLASGSNQSRTIGFVPPPTLTTILNVVSSTSDTTDPDLTNNNGSIVAAPGQPGGQVITTIGAVADIVTQKTAPATIKAGDTLIYTITTSNNGPSTATNVVITDSLIPGLTNVTVSDGGTYNETTGTIDFPAIATLTSGSNQSRTIRFVPPPTLTSILNVVSSTSNTTDPDLTNNNGSIVAAPGEPGGQVITTIGAVADLVTFKLGLQSAQAGSSVTYTITTSNNGPNAAENVVITDSIIPGLKIVTASNDGTYDPVTGIVTFPTIPSLASGSNTDRQVTLVIPGTGSISNTSSSRSTTFDPQQTNNNGSESRATVITTVLAGPIPIPTPTPGEPTPTPGEPTQTPGTPTQTPGTPTPGAPTPGTPTPGTPTPTPIFAGVPEPDTGCGCEPLPLLRAIAFIQPQPSQILNFDSSASALIDIENTLLGTPGNDYLTGNDTNELFVSFEGNDTLLGEGGSDILFGDQERDFIAAGRNNDIVYAGKENDVVFGGKQDDRIFGDRNSDTLYGDRGSDTIVGDNGNNIDLTGNDGDLIFGGSSSDAIAGAQGNDTVYGGKDADTVYGGKENDLIWGDKGPDTLYGDSGNDSLFGGVQNSLDSDPEGQDFLVGGNGQDLLNGQEGDDTLRGGNGRDVVFGGKGGDRIFGETGSDTLYGNKGSDTIVGDYGNPQGSINASDEGDLIFGNDTGDIIGGGSGNDSIFAGKGNDLAYGGKDNDIIWGELGADTIVGDEGDDSLYGGAANQLVTDVNGRDLLFGGDGNDYLNGGESSDSLGGGFGNDTVQGGKDDDLAHGDAGNDLIYGDDGNDILCGDDGNDTIFGDRGENELGPVGAKGQQDCINGGSGDDLLYGNEGQDALNGDDGNDTIYGGKDSDILNGGAGDDWLFGDGGEDTLIGGSGSDRFVLNSNSGIDTVLNFEVGTDKFVLADGLSFESLGINSTANGYVLQVAATGEVLANVFGPSNAITALDFVTQPR